MYVFGLRPGWGLCQNILSELGRVDRLMLILMWKR